MCRKRCPRTRCVCASHGCVRTCVHVYVCVLILSAATRVQTSNMFNINSLPFFVCLFLVGICQATLPIETHTYTPQGLLHLYHNISKIRWDGQCSGASIQQNPLHIDKSTVVIAKVTAATLPHDANASTI
jgi:hypothetical protein